MRTELWRRSLAEFVGTFGVVFAPVALSGTARLPGGDGSLFASALVSGLAVAAMIFLFGPISAAHFNPAVTLGFAAGGKFPWRHVAPYWIAEFSGGVLAAGVAASLFGSGHGAHLPAAGSAFRAVGMETILTFLLMLVIYGVATDRRVSPVAPPLAIGFTVVMNVMIGGAVTGGSMNPARSFGPALFAGGAALQSLWVYLLAPCLGAVLATALYERLRLHPEHAQGAPNDLLECAE